MEKLSNKDLPRICYVLGGEKTPLKIGERFGLQVEGLPSLLKKAST